MKMNANQIVLYATNEGRLYETHKDLAKKTVLPAQWRIHIKKLVLPMYRQEFQEPHEGMSREEIQEAAEMLADYYAEHLKECESA
jgi:hypothetical protein